MRWDPDIDADEVAVANGVVALTGFVRSYMQKSQAERDVKRLAGTLGVANDIDVRLPFINERPDPETARANCSTGLREPVDSRCGNVAYPKRRSLA
ncbi:MAG TPA: BON domain-containing protein, partial [Rhizomicrobium sp.]|nr:BON domain-containing protein [Rhizomicrobium sp.]